MDEAPLGAGLRLTTLRDAQGRPASAFVPQDDGGPGTALFLIPALGLDGRSFSRIAPACRGRRTLFWNPPNRLPSTGGMEALGRVVLEHLDRAGLREPVVLGGSSLGGVMAIQAALIAPGRVAGLVVIGTSPSWGQLWLPLRLVRYLHPLLPRRGYNRRFARLLLPTGDHPDLEALRTQMEHRDHAYAESVVACCSNGGGFDLRPRLGEVRVPTLLVFAENDRISGRGSRRSMEAIPGARSVSLPRGSHLPHVAFPGPVRDALAAFLAEIDAPGG